MKTLYKPIIFSICYLFLMNTSSYGQVELKPTIGINFTDVSKSPKGTESTMRAGWQAGASLLFGKRLYGEIGGYYAQKSTMISSDTNNAMNKDVKFSMEGIRIPATIGFRLIGNEESLIDIRAFGGGSAFIVTKVNEDVIKKSDVQSPTYGVFAGAGLDVWLLFFDLKYEWSLNENSTNDNYELGKSRSIFANVGFRFKL